MRTRRVPNQLLRDLLTEADWTGQALAKAVNELGAESGLRLHYDRTGVAHWLSGSCPRPPVPQLVAEAFSRRLGRRVAIPETGLAQPAHDDLPPWWRQDVASELIRLAEDDHGAVYSLTSLSVPSWARLSSTRPTTAAVEITGTTIGRLEVDSAETVLNLFSTFDVAFGGGRTHPAISAYLRSPMAPWLRAGARPSVRRRLLTSAARLSYLCGFTCFDDELHGAAQHYLLTAIRLAGEAADQIGYAITLNALCLQAHHLGHRQYADDLARSAVRSVTRVPAQTRAFLLGALAVTSAARGDSHAAVRHLRAAESQLERATSSRSSVVNYHLASFYHQRAAMHAHNGERAAAIDALKHSLRHRPAGERRDRAITLARLAELQLDEGRLDQACDTWQQFLDDYPLLASGRVNSALTTLRGRTRPHTNHPAAHAVNLRATMLSAGVEDARTRIHLCPPAHAATGS